MFSLFKSKKSGPPGNGPDWSNVDSPEKAEVLVVTGELVKLQLLPDIFGGDDGPHNTVFVPPFVVDIKVGIDNNTIMLLVEEGKVQRYVASPKYEGRSLVPCAIKIEATDPANFTAVVKIWGSALASDE